MRLSKLKCKGLRIKQGKTEELNPDVQVLLCVAESMTFARISPVGKDASHITKKYRKIFQKIIDAEIVESQKRERERVIEEVEKMLVKLRDEHPPSPIGDNNWRAERLVVSDAIHRLESL